MISLIRHLSRAITAAARIVWIGLVPLASGATFVVTSPGDNGAGSLRQAILDANSAPGADRIHFDITGMGPPLTIALASALPAITEAVALDATTQPGYAGTPAVTISGSGLPGTPHGLTLQTSGAEVRGLAIIQFRGNAIQITGGGNHVIAGNRLGIAANGITASGNSMAGIFIQGASRNFVGGTNANDQNVISANDAGIIITGFGSTGNRIAGNRIGTDATGTLDRGNTNHGVLLDNTGGNIVGGVTSSARNVISGNNRAGVYLNEALTTGNEISGNFIGTDITGTAAIANETNGIVIHNAPANIIGGTAPGAGNVISGNGERGILLQNTYAQHNRVEGNLIGLAASGQVALGNRASGVGFSTASFNMLGGTNGAARNVISGNQQSGVFIADARCVGNVVSGNFIGTDSTGAIALGNLFSGVVVAQGTNNVIGGSSAAARNIISGNTQGGVHLQGGSRTVVAGNYIGTDASGRFRVRNAQGGVRIDCAGNTVGGASPQARNVISGNGLTNAPANGVVLFGVAASNNVVAGNFIGMDATGGGALANTLAGIGITNAPRNIIGGTGPFEGNVLSGNASSGIYLSGSLAGGNRIQGNLIGTDATGMLDRGNLLDGITIYGTPGTLIGGPQPGAGNVISRNSLSGVWIGISASGTVIQGNLIGLRRDGSGLLGNILHGVEIDIATGTIVGGTAPGTGNRIADSTQAGYDGVRVRNTANGNSIRGNMIFGNGGSTANGLGIDLGPDGVTANDAGDNDTGGNSLQNFPVITSVTGRYTTRITGTLHSKASQTFTLDFHGSIAADASGYGEGDRWLGAASVTTGVDGNGSFSVAFTNLFGAGTSLAATATDTNGNTSEFGMAVPVIPAPDADNDGLPDDYETAAGLNPGSASDAASDEDRDGHANSKEFTAGTDPLDARDALRVTATPIIGGTVVTFPSVPGRLYRVESSPYVVGPWSVLADQLSGTGAQLRSVDEATSATRFYRVRVSTN